MNNMIAKTFAGLISAVAAAGGCPAEEMVAKGFDEATGVYVINVPEGREYQITSSDLSEVNANPIAKRGLGTLTVGAAMRGFTGDIRIEEGVYAAKDPESLGTADGETVVSNSATLKFICTVENKLKFADKITICGTVMNSGGVPQENAFAGPVVLGGNAAFSGQSIGFLNTTLALDGYCLDVTMNDSAILKFTDVKIVSAGDINVNKGRLHLMGNAVWAGDGNNILTIASDAMLGMREAKSDIKWKLNLEDGAKLYPSLGDVETFDGNKWSGPVVANGKVKVEYRIDSTQSVFVSLDGVVTGPGGFVVGNGTWLKLSNPNNAFEGGVDVQSGSSLAGGLILAANGALPADGAKLTVRSGEVRLSGREAYNLPEIEVTSAGRLTRDFWGYGGTISKLSKWGAHVFEYLCDLTVVGDTLIGKSTISLCETPKSVPGLKAAVTNFLTKAEWEEFIGGVASGSNPDASKLSAGFKKLLEIAEAQGFVKNVCCTEEAYRKWTEKEKYLMGAYSGYIWNNGTEDKICTFASSIADTAVLWINDSRVLMGVASKKDNTGQTHFVNIGECTLKPGPNSFRFFLGHRNSGTYGTRDDMQDGRNVHWASGNGLMYKEGVYDTSGVLKYSDFNKLIDAGDGLLFTETRDPSPDRISGDIERYRPEFANIKFYYNQDVRCTIDLGGMELFEQSCMTGCPRIVNGTMCINGEWSFTAANVAAHPLEVAPDAGIVFDNAVLSLPVESYSREPEGTVIIRCEDGGTIVGLPSVEAINPGNAVWEVKKEIREGLTCVVLYGRMRGTVVSFR
ncbi:MAG: hypothetical protein J6R18_02880 [Kiritimatiellae bacterium]|nr:hypothetical protein [Kiritimatiellia bacterium]